MTQHPDPASARIRRAQIIAAEQAVIDSIPRDLMDHMAQCQREFEAQGGCPGCGSMSLAVHGAACPEIKDDIL